MRRFVPLVVIATLLPLSSASAGPIGDLTETLNDIAAYEQFLKEQEFDATTFQEDIDLESAADLFPDFVTASSAGMLEQRREERVAAFVVAKIGATEIVFRDVPRTEWFGPYIRTIAEQGIVNGDTDVNGKPTGTFRPNDPVLVEELAKIAIVSSNMDRGTCPESAKNLTASGSWSAPFIACAEAKGWWLFADGTVDVKRPATRSEVVFTVLNAFNVAGAATTGSGWLTGFQDVPTSSPFAVVIGRAHADGIVHGYADADGIPTGLFGPADPVTRAEIAKIVALALEVYGR